MSEAGVVIHPTAVVDDEARLGAGVEIGPFTVVEGNVELGDNVKLGPHVHLASGSRLAVDVQAGGAQIHIAVVSAESSKLFVFMRSSVLRQAFSLVYVASRKRKKMCCHGFQASRR